ncbi:MAG: hypothetical protein JW860_04515, partial [Sedimentisphaerales bacterium]|nr:hypothetical protein [Sedimentisphaerales bacterium]
MAKFGRYESVREISRSGFSTVYSARLAGISIEENFAVKVLLPGIRDTDSAKQTSQADSFLESARVQQKICENTPQFWAPIHETGTSDEGTFYVTDFYPRSVQQLIYGRVRLPEYTLHAVVNAVIQGLLALKRQANRSHGNLKPTNVLISGEGQPENLKIVLTDPLPDSRIENRRDQISDFHALGEMIYQLIMHRPFSSVGGWPIPETPEWSYLGKKSEVWRALCNRLLTPHFDPESITLEDVAEKLEELRPVKTPLASYWPVLALTGVFLIIILAVVIIKMRGPEEVRIKITPEQWRSLCEDNYMWISPLKNDATLRQRWSADPLLKKLIMDALDESLPGHTRLNPQVILNRYDSLMELAGLNPGQLNDEQAQQALDAYNVISRIKESLKEEFLQDIVAISLKWRQENERQWEMNSQVLDTFITSYKQKIKSSPEPCPDLINAVNGFLKTRAAVAKIEQLWANARSLEGMISDTLQTQRQDQLAAIRQTDGFNDLQEKILDYIGWIRSKTTSARDWYDAIMQTSFLSDSLNRQWQTRRGALLDGVQLKDLEDNVSLYIEIKDKVEGTLAFFETLNDDKQLPRRFLRPDESGSVLQWSEVLEDKIAQAREDALQHALSNTLWDEDIPQLQDPDDWQNVCKDYRQLRDKAVQLVKDCSRIRKNLQNLFLLDDRPEANAPTLREIFTRWKDDTLYAEVLPRPAFQSLHEQVVKLLEIEKESDKDRLLREGLLNNQKPEVVYACWQRLGRLDDPPWPQSDQDWLNEQELQSRLAVIYQPLGSPRKEYLELELKEQGRRRHINVYAVQIQRLSEQMEGENILSDFKRFTRDYYKSLADLDPEKRLEMSGELEQLSEALVQYLLSDDWQNVNKAYFFSDSEVYRQGDEELTIDRYRNWLDEVGRYQIIPDPRDEWPEVVKVIQGAIDQMPAEFDRQGFIEKFREVTDRLDQLQNKEDIPAVLKHQAEIDSADTQLRQLLARIKPTPERIEAFIAEVRQAQGVPDVFVVPVWQRISGVIEQQVRPDPSFWSLKVKVDSVKAGLITLETETFEPLSITAPADRPWIKELIRIAGENRRKVLQEVISQMVWSDSIPDLQDKTFVDKVNELKEGYRLWFDLNELIADYYQIENWLDLYYLPRDKPDAGRVTINDNVNKWREHELLQNASVAAALQSLNGRISDLNEILTITDRQTLMARRQTLTDDIPQIQYALWRRMGDLTDPLWPAGLTERDLDRNIRTRLGQAYKLIQDVPRQQTLLAELETEGLRRDMIFERAEIRRLQEIIASAARQGDDKILAAFNEYAKDAAKKDDLDNLVAVRTLAQEVSTFITGDWLSRVEQNIFRAQGEVYRRFGAKADENTYRAWLTEAADYYRLEPDPRAKIDWNQKLADLKL